MTFDELIKIAPLKWSDRRMRALLEITTAQHRRIANVETIVSAIDENLLGHMRMEGSASEAWRSAFDLTAGELRFPDLVAELEQSSAALEQRIDGLREADPVVPIDPDPDRVGGDGFKGFSPEAELERQIIEDMPTLVDVNFLERGLERSRAVCRIEAGFGGFVNDGTGFRIGPDKILTNHHVVFNHEGGDAPAMTVQVLFRHEMGPDGQPRIPIAVNAVPDALIGDRVNDWAVITTATPMPDDAPILSLVGATEAVAVDDRVCIIQHPKGLPKKLGIYHNLVRFVDDQVVQYWTDTEVGSSGAPVFNEAWEVVALHHASVAVDETEDRYGHRNQGRAIGPVRDMLVAAGALTP